MSFLSNLVSFVSPFGLLLSLN